MIGEDEIAVSSIASVEAYGLRATVQRELLERLQGYIEAAFAAKKELKDIVTRTEGLSDGQEKARAYRENVVPAMERLRAPVDAAELIIDPREWPVPTYADLLFEV